MKGNKIHQLEPYEETCMAFGNRKTRPLEFIPDLYLY